MDKKQTRNVKVASFSVLALCFCSLMVFLTQQSQPPTIQAKALERAQIYATRMIDSKFMVSTDAPRAIRGLASTAYGQEVLEGPVGLDPWGHPFNFLVKKDSQNNKTGVVIVWSAGPDNKLDTTRDMIAEDHKSFTGDDFGKAYSFKL
ncbi:MAG: hypothetical protein ACRBBP_04255 [Bdellovibrionales bacterium]